MVKRNKTFKQKIIALANKRMGNSANEGRWQIKFTFDGKEYTKTHQLSEFEVRHMKDLCKEHGDLAADQLIWRAAIAGLTIVTENVLAQAGRDYVAGHWKPNVFERPVQQLEPTNVHVWPEDDHNDVDSPSPMNPDEA